jgi:hypothetical protein
MPRRRPGKNNPKQPPGAATAKRTDSGGGKPEARQSDRAWSRLARWAAGIIATALAAVLVSALTSLPSWVSKHVFQASVPPGPALTVAAEPVTLDDQGSTMATAAGGSPSQQILHRMSQPGAAASLGFLQEIRSDGGINVEASTVQLIVNGHSSQGIRITGIRPVALRRAAPLSGTLYLIPSQAGNATIKIMFDLDERVPVARQIASSADPACPFTGSARLGSS